MEKIGKFWGSFKARPDSWFFYGFLITSVLTIRKVLFFHPITGSFNEYSGVYFYLSDIFLLLCLFSGGYFIVRNKIYCLSILKQRLVYIPLLLVFFSFLSIAWSDYKYIALFRSIKLFELFLLYLYVKILFVPHRTFLINFFHIFIFLGLFEAFVGIFQFILQHSIGLFWLKESLISPDIPGVAKIVFSGENYIRAYGLFPHPNILGGFLVFSIILTYFYLKFVPRGTNIKKFNDHHIELVSGSQKTASAKILKQSHTDTPRNNADTSTLELFLRIALGIQIFALFLTFSKSAILALLVAIIYLFIQNNNNVPRETSFDKEYKLTIKRYFVIGMIIFAIMLFYFKIDLFSFFIKSLEERLIFLSANLRAITDNLFLGLGSGQFVLEMQKYSGERLLDWQFQPVHNVFLLITSELGLIGIFLFIWFLLELFHPNKNVPRETFSEENVEQLEKNAQSCHPELVSGSKKEASAKILKQVQNDNLFNNFQNCTKAILAAFIFIMLFDHYFWDIQQGSLMLWIIFGLI